MLTSQSDVCAELMWQRMERFLNLRVGSHGRVYPWLPDTPYFVSPLEVHDWSGWNDGIFGNTVHGLPSSLINSFTGLEIGIRPSGWGTVWQSGVFHPYWTGRLAVVQGKHSFDPEKWRLTSRTEATCVFAQHTDVGSLRFRTANCCAKKDFWQVFRHPDRGVIVTNDFGDRTHNVLLARRYTNEPIAQDPIECDFDK